MSSLRERSSILITGGAGFIGTNLAESYLAEGWEVILLDNLSRGGVEANMGYLNATYPGLVKLIKDDVRNGIVVKELVARAAKVFHFAAQVAVTTSLTDPMGDFGVNALGTLNVLEAARLSKHKPKVVFTSTNKVYGALGDVEMTRVGSRYGPVDENLAMHGVNERQPLDFHSPYGCSKGCADQYVLDYGRCYGLPAVVFRMSCICGPHQQGNEDQGWVAHFVKKILSREPITIYGDGFQVRDVLYVDDLVQALRLAGGDGLAESSGVFNGVFNMGGGLDRAASVIDVIDSIQKTVGIAADIDFAQTRTGDQRWYVSDHSKFSRATGWKPQVTLPAAIERLTDWFSENKGTVRVPQLERAAQCASL
jgi:CDP-paratose 2-epimerase